MDSQEAATKLSQICGASCNHVNEFTREVFRTRGGRIGSGMGLVLEALWGYYTNKVLRDDGAHIELGWMVEHGYNDFACVQVGQTWQPETREGELLRIEAKSMNIGADESKGHFDEILENIGEWDQLLVLVWAWDQCDQDHVYPTC